MSGGPLKDGDMRLEEACDWVVRLADGDAEDALAFDAWLEASRANRQAYDQALATWHAYGAHAGEVLDALPAGDRGRARRLPLSGAWLAAGGVAAAAAVALAVAPLWRERPAPVQTYATGVGEQRAVTLADGSRIDLNAGSRLRVTLRRGERDVALDQGEAVFDVAKDPHRPFVIAAGDRAVRVVGTQFDVRRRAGQLSVTVARGVVEVRPSAEGRGHTFRLYPGQRLDHPEGAAWARVGAVEAAEAFSWRTGRLVYRAAPLSQVVADLNAQFARPIRLDPQLAQVSFSGVLVLDDEDAVVRRLASLAPLTAVASDGGVLLRRREAPRS